MIRLRYETGIAAMIQFLVMMLLAFVIAVVSTVKGCSDASASDCVGGAVIPLIYILILALLYGFLAVLGYAVQDRRDRRLAMLLIGMEFLVFAIALFNAKHHPSGLELVNSLIDAAFAVWVMLLAFRLVRAKGGRITAPARARRRPIKKA